MSLDVIGYWDHRFQEEGRIWGGDVSPSVKLFACWLEQYRCKRVLVVGSGYGRGARYLAECGFQVDAVDTSPSAIRLANEDAVVVQPDGSASNLYKAWVDDATVLETVETGRYDAVVADKLWHLFDVSERDRAVQSWERVVRPGGLICCNAFSPEDPSYVSGELVAEETRKLPDGKTVFFASTDVWRRTWKGCEFLSQGTMREEYAEVILLFHFVVVRV